MSAEVAAQVLGSYELPGEAVFPESIGADAATGDAYVGSLADGALYRPLGATGRIHFEVTELHPFSAFEVLFAGQVRP